ncbi:hypothetical protein KV205_27240 [Streptomyces sp. SKN60]|uniref:hypothetical protein n=1 Tax=Streptomyces sp. SKN60 TaxID=2855506 RepID=UPI0022458DBC|nr:hypothetical protein [Streptomyces sp. SKN60]MCX2184197.1 hypothetical protein [Streptomyces sp. SKN60]
MGAVLPLVAIFGGLLAVLGGCVWLAVRVRRRGTAGGGARAALAAWEEAYRITSYEAYQEITAGARRKTPLPSPDGPGGPGGRWRARLRLTRRER